MKSSFLTKFLILFLIAIVSCDSEKDLDQNLFFYDQTKCLDAWDTGANDSNSETSKALKKYLKDLGVDVLKVELEDLSQIGDITCDACSCTTGVRITISITESDNQKVIDVGFKKVE